MKYRIIKIGSDNVKYKIQSDRGTFAGFESAVRGRYYDECVNGEIIYVETIERAENILSRLIEKDRIIGEDNKEEVVKEIDTDKNLTSIRK